MVKRERPIGFVSLILCLALVLVQDPAVRTNGLSAQVGRQTSYRCRIDIEPSAPKEGDLVWATISGEWGSSCIPNHSSHLRERDTIRLYAIAQYPPGTVCTTVITPFELTEFLGTLSRGTYTADAYTCHQAHDCHWDVESCASESFSVTATSPILIHLPLVVREPSARWQ